MLRVSCKSDAPFLLHTRTGLKIDDTPGGAPFFALPDEKTFQLCAYRPISNKVKFILSQSHYNAREEAACFSNVWHVPATRPWGICNKKQGRSRQGREDAATARDKTYRLSKTLCPIVCRLKMRKRDKTTMKMRKYLTRSAVYDNIKTDTAAYCRSVHALRGEAILY